MSRILVVSTDAVGPLDQGFRIRVHHLVAALLRSGHEVTLLARPSAAGDPAELEALGAEVLTVPAAELGAVEVSPFLGKLHRHLVGRPSGSLAHHVPAFSRALRRLLAERSFDAVQVEIPELVAQVADLGVPVVYDAHNIWSELTRRRRVLQRSRLRRALMELTYRRQLAVERRAWHTAQLCLATSGRELRLLAEGGARQAALVPNGADIDRMRPLPHRATTKEPPYLVFVGLLRYGPNADAVTHLLRDILPLVHARRPDVRLVVVGRGASPALTELAGPSVRFTGGVREIRPYIAGATASVVPLRVGSGTRLKILEALASALPVVSTSVGAEGIDVVDGVHALVADGPRAFADAVLRLLDEPGLAERLGTAGRDLAVSAYAWDKVGDRLDAAYADLLSTRHAPH